MLIYASNSDTDLRIPQNLWEQLTDEKQYQVTQLLARLAFNWFTTQRQEGTHEKQHVVYRITSS